MIYRVKKAVVLGLATLILASSINTTAFANSEIVNSVGSSENDTNVTEGSYPHNYGTKPNTVIGYDGNQNRASEQSLHNKDSTANTKVYMSQEESVEVVLPKTIVLDGSNTTAAGYKIKAAGNIAGDTILKAEPLTNSQTVYHRGETYDGDSDAYFYLGSKGKRDVISEVNQSKTSFVYNDVKNLQSGQYAETTGTVESNISAGMWHGSFNFDIELINAKTYYSNLSDAVADANNLTTANADVSVADIEDAVAGLYVDNSKAYLFLMNNVTNQESFTLSNNTEIEMGGYSISFKKDSNTVAISAEKDITLENGVINVPNKYAVSSINNAYNNTKSLNLKNVQVNETLTSDVNSLCYAVATRAAHNNLENCTLDVTGTGNSTKNTGCFISSNPDGEINIKNCVLSSDVVGANIIRATQLVGESIVENCEINFDTSVNKLYGFYVSASATDTSISNCDITTNDETAVYHNAICMQGLAGTIKNCEIYADSMAQINSPAAIASKVNGDLKIKDCNAYGKDWGLETFAYNTTSTGKTIVSDSTFSSACQPIFISSFADFTNCTLKAANRSTYSTVNIYGGSFFGGQSDSTNQDADVNFYNCTFGGTNTADREYARALVAFSDSGYVPIDNVNLYNCNVYCGVNQFFGYNSREAAPAKTKFNLYGRTKLIDNSFNEISASQLEEAVAAWKTTPVRGYNGDSNKFFPSAVGWRNIVSLYNSAVVDIDTGEISAVYVTEDANIYDYR